MTSREAFEAALTRAIEEQKDPRFYSTIDAINWAWQAAIQHGRMRVFRGQLPRKNPPSPQRGQGENGSQGLPGDSL